MKNNIDLSNCDTLFLDRDGVINRLLINDYVKTWNDFEFLPGVLAALKILNSHFKHIIIVTNQRGVGKGLMSEKALLEIHERMMEEIGKCGGRIDKIYYCTDILESSPNRKPNIGMALRAKVDFPDINFKNSIMIGDSESDMIFGNKLEMKTISTKDKLLIDIVLSQFPSL